MYICSCSMAKAPVTEEVPDAVAVKVAPTVPTLRTESAQEPLSKLPPLSSKSCSPVLSEMSTVRVSPGGYPEPQSLLLPCRWKYTVRSVGHLRCPSCVSVPSASGLLQRESISKLAGCAQAAPNKRMHHQPAHHQHQNSWWDANMDISSPPQAFEVTTKDTSSISSAALRIQRQSCGWRSFDAVGSGRS